MLVGLERGKQIKTMYLCSGKVDVHKCPYQSYVLRLISVLLKVLVKNQFVMLLMACHSWIIVLEVNTK